MNDLGKLAELRKKSKLTQSEVAEELGVSRQAVSRWETGEMIPSAKNLRRLSEMYGEPLDDLVSINGPVPEKASEQEKAPEPGPAARIEQENAKPRKMRWIWFAAAVVLVLGILISAIIYIATVEQEPDAPIPIEDLEKNTASPAPKEFGFEF